MTTFLHAPRQVQNQLLRAHRRVSQKQDARSACGATTPGWHRQSIRAETATQSGVYNRCLVHLQDSADYACSNRGARWTLQDLLEAVHLPKARSFRCSTRWPAVPQLSPEQVRVSVVESRAV